MSVHTPQDTVLSAFYLPIKNEVKHFSSVIGILDKLELDKNLDYMGTSFTQIIQAEMEYAVEGEVTRTEEDQRVHSVNRPE